MESNKKMKICFAASSGGHYEQLMMLKPLMEEYDSFVVEKKILSGKCSKTHGNPLAFIEKKGRMLLSARAY